MSPSLRADELVNLLLMERAAGDHRVALAVEGEEDCALLDLHLDWRVAKTQFAGSKTAVLAAAARADRESINWIAFIVDADFDRHNGRSALWPPNIIASEHTDLFADAALASPDVLPAVLASHGAARSRSLEADLNSPLGSFCVEVACFVGAIREAIVDGEITITARGWDFSGVVLAATKAEGALPVIVAEAVRRSNGSLQPADVERAVRGRLSLPVDDRTRYLNGHDLIGVASEVARHIRGRSVRRESISAACRVAFRCEGFVTLRVVQEVRAWAFEAHTVDPFRCTLAA